MRVSIIPEDKKIIVDGKTIDLEDNAPWDFNDKHIHAIQWKDGNGSLEYEDIPGQKPVPNKIFGEEEFDTIVKPYLDYFNEFLTIYEQKQLAAAIAEEENLAAQIEELNLDKLEKEAQLVIIEDLQRQNKELRDEREELFDEQSRLLQKEVYDEQTAKMAIERQKIAHEQELLALETQKADEYFKNKELDLQKNYEKLLIDFEKQKDLFIEERKEYQELLAKEKDRLEKESIQSEIHMTEKEIIQERQKELDHQLIQEEYERLDNRKLEIESEKQALSIQWEMNQEIINDMLNRRQNYEKEMTLKHDELQKLTDELNLKRMRIEEDRMNVDTILESRKEIGSLLDNEKILSEYDQITSKLSEESDLAASFVFERDNLLSKIDSTNKQLASTQDLLDNVYENANEISKSEYSVDDIIALMDEVDPEKLYTTLTSNENNDTEFPVDKAVKWFSALKDAIDKSN